MRVLLGIHTALNPNQGASGITLALGRALAYEGCQVDYYSFSEAWPSKPGRGAFDTLRFPWKLAAHLALHAGRYSVIDVTSGDAYLWSRLGRPSAARRHALITRVHGLEHTADEQWKRDAAAGHVHIGWKHPIYHGGFRLWEVRQSLLTADGVIMGNRRDLDYAAAKLSVAEEKMTVIPNGLNQSNLNSDFVPGLQSGPIRLVWLAGWRVGKRTAQRVSSLIELER